MEATATADRSGGRSGGRSEAVVARSEATAAMVGAAATADRSGGRSEAVARSEATAVVAGSCGSIGRSIGSGGGSTGGTAGNDGGGRSGVAVVGVDGTVASGVRAGSVERGAQLSAGWWARSDRLGKRARHWAGSRPAATRVDRAVRRCRPGRGRQQSCSAASREGRPQRQALRSWRWPPPTWPRRATHGEVVACACSPSSVEVVSTITAARSGSSLEQRGKVGARLRRREPAVGVPHLPDELVHGRERIVVGEGCRAVEESRSQCSSWLAFEEASERGDTAMLQRFDRSR